MKQIIYENNGSVEYLTVSPDFQNDIQKALSFTFSNTSNLKWAIVEVEELPLYFFEFISCWDWNFENYKHPILNLKKAKEIWLNHYRRARTPLLASLDVDFMRAVESGNIDLQKEIAQKKQALRDVTKTELPNTLEGIKNTWPEILGENPFNK